MTEENYNLLKFRIDELLDLTLENYRFIYFSSSEKNIIELLHKTDKYFDKY